MRVSMPSPAPTFTPARDPRRAPPHQRAADPATTRASATLRASAYVHPPVPPAGQGRFLPYMVPPVFLPPAPMVSKPRPMHVARPSPGAFAGAGKGPSARTCRFGDACFSRKCKFAHPGGPLCKFGSRCNRGDACSYRHLKQAPWRHSHAVRAALQEVRRGRDPKSWVGDTSQSISLLLENIVRPLAAFANTGSRAALADAWRNIRCVLVFDESASELRFSAHCQHLSKRYEGKASSAHPFHPTWDTTHEVRFGVSTTPSLETILWRHEIIHRLVHKHQDLSEGLSGFSSVSVHLVFHGCSTVERAEDIARNGFANMATKNQGYYGAGMYFTYDLEQARRSYGPVVLVCLVGFGNPYPVVEAPGHSGGTSFYGRACVPKYDCHVTVADCKKNLPVEPIRWKHVPTWSILCAFESASVLPIAALDFGTRA